jgi:hypothetical protein
MATRGQPKGLARWVFARPSRIKSWNWTTGNDPDIAHGAYIASGGFGDVHKVYNPTSILPYVEDAKQDDGGS